MKQIIREYGDKEETRGKMAAAAKRAVKKGNAEVYNNAIGSLTRRNSTKKEMGDFQDKFETIEDDMNDLNDQPTNNLATNEGKQYKVNEEQLHQIIKESVMRILNEIDWRTVHNAMDMAGEQSIDPDLPSGLKQRRNQQWQRFKDGLTDRMRSQYGGLDKEQVRDAKAGKGASYNTADRRQLRNMDKLNADYSKFMSANSKNPADELYKDGKWQ